MPTSAINWLQPRILDLVKEENKQKFLDLMDQVKKIEKYQIMDAYDMGWHQSGLDNETSEKYYREMYDKENNK